MAVTNEPSEARMQCGDMRCGVTCTNQSHHSLFGYKAQEATRAHGKRPGVTDQGGGELPKAGLDEVLLAELDAAEEVEEVALERVVVGLGVVGLLLVPVDVLLLGVLALDGRLELGVLGVKVQTRIVHLLDLRGETGGDGQVGGKAVA